jgi:hypothetical protein
MRLCVSGRGRRGWRIGSLALARVAGGKSIAVAPIMPISGMGESGTALDQEHGPVAVMLDLMNPVSPFRRLVGEAR